MIFHVISLNKNCANTKTYKYQILLLPQGTKTSQVICSDCYSSLKSLSKNSNATENIEEDKMCDFELKLHSKNVEDKKIGICSAKMQVYIDGGKTFVGELNRCDKHERLLNLLTSLQMELQKLEQEYENADDSDGMISSQTIAFSNLKNFCKKYNLSSEYVQ